MNPHAGVLGPESLDPGSTHCFHVCHLGSAPTEADGDAAQHLICHPSIPVSVPCVCGSQAPASLTGTKAAEINILCLFSVFLHVLTDTLRLGLDIWIRWEMP